MSATITKEPSYNEMVDALAYALGLSAEEVRTEKQRYIDDQLLLERFTLDEDQIQKTQGRIRALNLSKMGDVIANIRNRMAWT